MVELWKRYEVRLDFLNRLCGSVPGSSELIAAWLEARKPKVKPPGGKSITEIQEEVFTTIATQEPEVAEKMMLIFQRQADRLVVRSSTFRSHLKDCARIIGSLYVGKIKGERSFASRFVNAVYHDEQEYWTTICDSAGNPVSKPTGTFEKPVHARLRDGSQINCLKNFEFVQNARLTFKLKILTVRTPKARPAIAMEDLEIVLSYGATHGYGGERGDGEGRYLYQIKEIENGG